jgi:hypothetical protein
MSGFLAAAGVRGFKGLSAYQNRRVRRAIESGEPPFHDGQPRFPFMKDYVTWLRRQGP